MIVETERSARFGNAAARLLAATALSTLVTFPAHAEDTRKARQPDETSTLDKIVVKTGKFLTKLNGKTAADTGTIVLGEEAMELKSTGGDANSALKNNPNVQYQVQSSNDAGSDVQDLINTRPKLLSISGGKVWENNFRINGIGINSITGTEEPFGSQGFGTELQAYEDGPNINKIYGAHPQTVFVPSEFVSETTVIDSNASARYGEFLGGVVDYKLKAPTTEKAGGSISFGFTADELTTYDLATKSGGNPQGMPKPTYGDYKGAIQYNLPINDDWAILTQYSRRAAQGNKVRTPLYYSTPALDDSRNETFRLSSRHDTDNGTFTLDGVMTNYSQTWDATQFYNTVFDIRNRALSTSLRWEKDIESLAYDPLGLKNVKADSTAYFNTSRIANDSGGNATYNWSLTARSATTVTNPASWFHSTDPAILAMCQENPADFVSWGKVLTCRTGGHGTKQQGQQDSGFKSDVEGDILSGTFSAGLEYRHTEAYRKAEEYTFYSTSNTLVNRAGGYTCPPGADGCTPEQYFNIKTVTPAYHNKASLNHFSAYGELDQTWDWFNLRGGLRFDYEDFFGNLDLSPRVVATVTPVEGYSFLLGYNRYYSADSLSYAVRNGQPLSRAYSRTHNAAGNVQNWTVSAAQRYYAFNATDVDTPYEDEFTASFTARDPWAEGEFRLRFMERRGHDEFMSDSSGSTVNYTLTNDGESMYRSLTAEYEKSWDVTHTYLDNVKMLASATWSKRKTTTVSPFRDDEENWFWYHQTSYSPEAFGVVTGNLDIPIRSSVDLTTNWLEERLAIGVAANINLPFEGVRFTDSKCTPTTSASSSCRLPAGSEGIGKEHNVYEDYSYRATVTFDVKARYRIAQKGDNALDLQLDVYNIFNETGNSRSTDANPWVVGRTVWLGAKATF